MKERIRELEDENEVLEKKLVEPEDQRQDAEMSDELGDNVKIS